VEAARASDLLRLSTEGSMPTLSMRPFTTLKMSYLVVMERMTRKELSCILDSVPMCVEMN